MVHREWMTLILAVLAFVLFVCGMVSFVILPPIVRIVVGLLLFIVAIILGSVSLEFLPRDEEEEDEDDREDYPVGWLGGEERS